MEIFHPIFKGHTQQGDNHVPEKKHETESMENNSAGVSCFFGGAPDGSPPEIHSVDSVSQSADQSCANLVLANY